MVAIEFNSKGAQTRGTAVTPANERVASRFTIGTRTRWRTRGHGFGSCPEVDPHANLATVASKLRSI